MKRAQKSVSATTSNRQCVRSQSRSSRWRRAAIATAPDREDERRKSDAAARESDETEAGEPPDEPADEQQRNGTREREPSIRKRGAGEPDVRQADQPQDDEREHPDEHGVAAREPAEIEHVVPRAMRCFQSSVGGHQYERSRTDPSGKERERSRKEGDERHREPRPGQSARRRPGLARAALCAELIRPDPQGSEEPPASRIRRSSHRQTVQEAIAALNPGRAERSWSGARLVSDHRDGSLDYKKAWVKTMRPAGSGVPAAAFFDLDRTLIASSSSLALARPFHERGLIGRRQLLKARLAQAVLAHVGAPRGREGQATDSAMAILKGRPEDCCARSSPTRGRRC